MYYVNEKQAEVFNVINKFGCIRTDQIEKITGFKDIEKNTIKSIQLKKAPIKFQNGTFFSFAQKIINPKMIRALDVYTYLNSGADKKVDWCVPSSIFPFVLSLFRNGNVYDIAVVNPKEENALMAAIDRSPTDRVIVILESPIQAEKIKTSKNCRLCFFKDNNLVFFEPPESEAEI